MLFNSYNFIFAFLPITLIVYFGLSKFRLGRFSQLWLVIASLYFYAHWSIVYLPLLLISIGVNYLLSEAILASQTLIYRQRLLWFGLLFNFGLLGYFKYFNFFADSFVKFSHLNLSLPEIVLPIGISFYTFTQSAYLIDAFHEKARSCTPLTYALFVTYFPHLIAGPILHHKEVIPQFKDPQTQRFSQENFALGLSLFLIGLVKKVLIADSLSRWLVAPVFSQVSRATGLESWIGVLGYTFQLYFDFSGYSDMAVALGLMLNVQLPINFNSPYKAQSISDFWRRWHITLSNYLRDYLYIPLGGNRRGQIRQSINLSITMLLGGLWHGAGWTFIVWGGFHGICLVIDHYWKRLNIHLPRFIAWALTFVTVMIGWVFFRAQSLQEAKQLLSMMFGLQSSPPALAAQSIELIQSWASFFAPQLSQSFAAPKPLIENAQSAIAVLGLLFLWVLFLPNSQSILKKKWALSLHWALLLGGLGTLCLLSLNQASEFLYFQF